MYVIYKLLKKSKILIIHEWQKPGVKALQCVRTSGVLVLNNPVT